MSADAATAMELHDVRFGFASRPDFLGPVSLKLAAGECWAVVGPNGAGKSTLLRIMAGLLEPHAGSVTVDGHSLNDLSIRDRARRIAFMPQQLPTELADTVTEVVLWGRHPHRGLGIFESADDRAQAERAMRVTGTLPFADRRLDTLSGGEAQRVHLAAALAQQTKILLLDEPTASLDLVHQQDIFRVLRHTAMADGVSVVVVTHDVNLAASYGTHALVLDDGGVAAAGPTKDVLTPEVLSPVYGVELISISTSEDSDRRWLVPAPGRIGTEIAQC